MAVIIAVAGTVIATFGLGIWDIWEGQLSGNLYPQEQILRVMGLFLLFLLSLLIAPDHPLTSMGVLLLGSMGLLRGGVAWLDDDLVGTAATIVTISYLLIGLLGCVIVVIGLRSSKGLGLFKAKSPNGPPSWLKQMRPGSETKTLPAKATSVPVLVRSVQILSIVSNLLNLYVFQYARNWSEYQPVPSMLTFMLLVAVVMTGLLALIK
jgi:hypothetical protein